MSTLQDEHRDTETIPDAQHNLSEAEILLKENLDRYRQALSQQIDTLYSDLEALLRPYRQACSNAAEQHSTLLAPLQPASPLNTQQLAASVLHYSTQVEQTLLLPVREALTPQLINQVFLRYRAFYESLHATIQKCEKTILIDEPKDLYRWMPQDSLPLRLSKFRFRIQRLFKRKTTVDQRIPIPVRSVLLTHLHTRLSPALEEAFQTSVLNLRNDLNSFENDLTHWVYTVLGSESTTSLPARGEKTPLKNWISGQEEFPTANPDSISNVIKQASSLQELLSNLGKKTDFDGKLFKDSVQAGMTMLDKDMLRASTLLIHTSQVKANALHEDHLEAITRQSEDWKEWYNQIHNRFQLNQHLFQIRGLFRTNEKGLMERIAQSSLDPFARAFDTLSQACEEAKEAIIKESPTGDQDEDLAPEEIEARIKGLEAVQKRLIQQFRVMLRRMPGFVDAGKLLSQAGKREWEDIRYNCSLLPYAITVHELRTQRNAVKNRKLTHTNIYLRNLSQKALGAPLSNRVAKPARSLQDALILTWGKFAELQQMVDLHFNSAQSELSEVVSKNDAQETEQTSPAERSSEALDELVAALDRIHAEFSTLATPLDAAWKEVGKVSHLALNEDWQRLLKNISVHDQARGPLEAFFFRSRRRFMRVKQSAGERFSQFYDHVLSLLKLGRSSTKAIIRKTQSAIGAIEQTEEKWQGILDNLTDTKKLYAGLPLIYQKLFAFSPLEEPALFEGRQETLEYIQTHYQRWIGGQVSALVLTMPMGSGRTSLMNILRETTFKGSPIYSLTLEKRITEEAVFAGMVANAIACPIENIMDLDVVEEWILQDAQSDKRAVCFIENLEHLLLRKPAGSTLLERVLLFFSRTDERICWVANTGNLAWHFIEKTLPAAAGFVTCYRLPPLSRDAIRDMILSRHRLSGIPLYFEGSQRSSSWYKFWGNKNDEQLQETYQKQFFDRLHELSGQNILLAFYYWLTSSSFNDKEDTIIVKNIKAIDFGFLDTLDLPKVFALGGFMQHGSMTLKEHNQVFRLNQTEGTFILEALLKLRIIKPVGAIDSPPSATLHNLLPDVPYRIHPHILHPVVKVLTDQNMIY